MTLHQAISAAITKSGTPITHVATKAGVTRKTIYAWTSGESIPGYTALQRLCEALSVDPAPFFRLAHAEVQKRALVAWQAS